MSTPGRSRRLPAALLAVLLVSSAWGLLCTRISDYDDAVLLVGARLVHAGLLPYRDFYSHYGPLGFTLQAGLSGLIGNPPLALRLGQAMGLALAAGLAFWSGRRAMRGAPAAWAAAAFGLALSPAALLPSFYGFVLTLAALGAYAMSQGAPTPRAADGWAAGSGALLAVSALTRPAFAAYALIAIAFLDAVLGSAADRKQRLLGFSLALAGTLALGWALLYPALSPALAFDATIRFPQRIMQGGRRYREAAFLAAPLPLAFFFATLHVAIPLTWTAALRSPRARLFAAVGLLASGALTLWLRVSPRPARDAALVSIGTVVIVALVIASQRHPLSQNAVLRAAALFGLAAAAFEHYLWSRADRPHFLLFLVTGAAGAALTALELRALGRWLLAGFFLFLYGFFARSPDAVLAPVESLWGGGAAKTLQRLGAPGAGWKGIWPCGEVPADAARAVAFADRNADPASRFVAVASNQAFTDQNPILLFLLSSRLPYTRWYQYDPGLQSSEPVQREMIAELERSDSRTAVVWFSDAYAPGISGGSPPRTPFDEAFDRLYPVRGPRVGLYEIRLRASTPSSEPPP